MWSLYVSWPLHPQYLLPSPGLFPRRNQTRLGQHWPKCLTWTVHGAGIRWPILLVGASVLGCGLVWSSNDRLGSKYCQRKQLGRHDQFVWYKLCGTMGQKCHHSLAISSWNKNGSHWWSSKKLGPIRQPACEFAKTWKLCSKFLPPKLLGKRSTPRVSMGNWFAAFICLRAGSNFKKISIGGNHRFNY